MQLYITTIKFFDQFLSRRWQDLQETKPGALIEEGFPLIIWVRMLKRPKHLTEVNPVYQARGKFNNILEERLSDGLNKDTHRIMSVEIPPEEFYESGALTNAGMKISGLR